MANSAMNAPFRHKVSLAIYTHLKLIPFRTDFYFFYEGMTFFQSLQHILLKPKYSLICNSSVSLSVAYNISL